jgi:hypothetical protein
MVTVGSLTYIFATDGFVYEWNGLDTIANISSFNWESFGENGYSYSSNGPTISRAIQLGSKIILSGDRYKSGFNANNLYYFNSDSMVIDYFLSGKFTSLQGPVLWIGILKNEVFRLSERNDLEKMLEIDSSWTQLIKGDYYDHVTDYAVVGDSVLIIFENGNALSRISPHNNGIVKDTIKMFEDGLSTALYVDENQNVKVIAGSELFKYSEGELLLVNSKIPIIGRNFNSTTKTMNELGEIYFCREGMIIYDMDSTIRNVDVDVSEVQSYGPFSEDCYSINSTLYFTNENAIYKLQ